MSLRILAALLSLGAFAEATFCQECQPYFDTSMNLRGASAPHYFVSVPDIPGDRLPGGMSHETGDLDADDDVDVHDFALLLADFGMFCQ